MQTIMIFDQCGEAEIKFFVLEGDYNHLNGVYINTDSSSEQDDEEYEKKKDELYSLLYTHDGKFKIQPMVMFPVYAIVNNPSFPVIVSGFAP